MSISITLGKAVLVPVTVSLSNGGTDTTTALGLGNNQTSNVKIAVNPSNPREVGILALAPTTGATLVISAGSFSATLVVSVPTPTINGVTLGMPGSEIDPPTWLTA